MSTLERVRSYMARLQRIASGSDPGEVTPGEAQWLLVLLGELEQRLAADETPPSGYDVRS